MNKYSLTKFQKTSLNQEIDPRLIKERTVSGTKLSYFPVAVVIDILNRVFDYIWSFEIKEISVRESRNKNQKDRSSGETKSLPQGPVVNAIVKLTVPIFSKNGDVIWITKEACGSKTVVGGQSEQSSDNKAAVSDALKKAATLLGIGKQIALDSSIIAALDEYLSPWNEKMLQKYSNELQFITDYFKKNKIDESQKSIIIASFCDEKNNYEVYGEIDPDNIVDFVKWLKSKEYSVETSFNQEQPVLEPKIKKRAI